MAENMIQDQIDLERGPLEDEFDSGEDPYWQQVMRDREEEFYAEGSEEEMTRIIFACTGNTDDPNMWWVIKDVPESEMESEEETAQKEHNAQCRCGCLISTDIVR